MRIMYISNESTLGGAAQSLLDMLKEIKKYVEPIVIIPGEGLIEERLKELNIEYYIISFSMGYAPKGRYNQIAVDKNFLDNYEAALSLLHIIQNKKIDIVHTNSSVSNVGAMAAILAAIPHVWHVRELLEEHYGYEFMDEILKLELLEYADEVISISNCVKQIFLEKYGIRSVCLYNGLDIEKYKEKFKECVTKQEIYKFLIIGAVSYGKGQLDAVKAFSILIKEGIRNIQLNIVGPQDAQYVWLLKQYIRKEDISEFVHIYSFRKDLSDLRRESTFSITSSKSEALGRLTLEAMLAGNIVIGANKGGTLEIVGENQERGYLYEQGNAVSLAYAIKHAIDDVETGKKDCRKKAQEYVLQNFDSKQYAKNVVEIYNRILQKEVNGEKNKVLGDKLQRKYCELKQSYGQMQHLKSNQEQKAWDMFKYSQLWLKIHQAGKSLVSYFCEKEWHRIAIYGMGHFGCCLCDELQGSNIEVCYGIDKNFIGDDSILTIKRPEETLEEVDVIVVTVRGGEDNIMECLKEKTGYPIVLLWEILEKYMC